MYRQLRGAVPIAALILLLCAPAHADFECCELRQELSLSIGSLAVEGPEGMFDYFTTFPPETIVEGGSIPNPSQTLGVVFREREDLNSPEPVVVGPFSESIPSEHAAYLLVRTVSDPTPEDGPEGDILVPGSFSLAQVPIPASDGNLATAESASVTFSGLPAFGTPEALAGEYTLLIAQLPERKWAYSDDPICETDWQEWCEYEVPYTLDDFKRWYEWQFVDYGAYDGETPSTQGPIDSASFTFTYVAGGVPGCTSDCFSSVLFLPGIMGSRLFEGGTKRWEPSGDADIQTLYLDTEGKSVRLGISAEDVVDEVPVTGGNIYKSFLADLASKKSSGVIADYAAVPYDWRLSIPDILAEGNIESELRRLAGESQTGKVTVVAHSNGGLVGKALINELGGEAAELIDQLILVAVPQIGTPQAVGALLHGYDTGLPFDSLSFILSPERARDFAKNAPMAYQLLPHADYYNSAGATIPFPLASFESGTAVQQFINAYGGFVGNGAELHDFLTGAEGRGASTYGDLKNPALANGALLAAAEQLQQSIGSSWQAPAGIVVHQIAGIGEDTLAGITYKTVRECTNFVLSSKICFAYEDRLSYTPETVIDGDGTVVVPSALAMSGGVENVKRWWVDLKANNDANSRFGPFRIEHADILEVPELRAFIFDNLIAKGSAALPTYLSATQPNITKIDRLRFVLHSPLSLSATDASGNTTGENDSAIPDAHYKRYGDVQVLTVPKDAFPTIRLDGVADGSFTLEVQELAGGAINAATAFVGVPSTAATVATLSFPDGTIQNAGNLVIDYDGDGAPDLSLAPEEGGEVGVPEPSLTYLLTVLKVETQSLSVKDNLKKNLLKKIDNLEKKIEKKKQQNAKILAKMEKKVSKQAAKGKIDAASADDVLELLDALEAQSDEVSLDADMLAALKNAILALDAKQNVKNNLLKRVEKLENQRALAKALANFAAKVAKKGEKGKIGDADVEKVLQLLDQIESAI